MDKYEELQNKIENLKETVEQQERLINNLLRINKEKANVKRNLRPKKYHSGFVVMTSQERQERVKTGFGFEIVNVWETTIQTPYSIEFAEYDARRQIFKELMNVDFDDDGLLFRIGICNIRIQPLQEILENNDLCNLFYDANTAYECLLRANYKIAFWECIIRHSYSLKNVPEEMRPAKKRGGESRNESK